MPCGSRMGQQKGLIPLEQNRKTGSRRKLLNPQWFWTKTPLFSSLSSSSFTAHDCPCFLLSVEPSSSSFSCSSSRDAGRKECLASTSLIPSLAFHRPLLTPCRWGWTFLRTQRGCRPVQSLKRIQVHLMLFHFRPLLTLAYIATSWFFSSALEAS